MAEEKQAEAKLLTGQAPGAKDGFAIASSSLTLAKLQGVWPELARLGGGSRAGLGSRLLVIGRLTGLLPGSPARFIP